jgi:hypothetical protein
MREGGVTMLDFTWRLFTKTGNIDTYLLFKEIEKELTNGAETEKEELTELDFPVS